MFLWTLFFLMQRAVVFWRAAFSTRENRCLAVANRLLSNLTKIALRQAGEGLRSWGRFTKPGSGRAGARSAGSSVLPRASFQGAFLLGTDTAKAPAPRQMFLQQLWSKAAHRIQCHTQGFMVHLSLRRGLGTDEIECLKKHKMRGFVWYFVSARVAGESPQLRTVLLYTTATFFKANSW